MNYDNEIKVGRTDQQMITSCNDSLFRHNSLNKL